MPFVSTTHYSLLAALKHEGVDPKSVEILNLRPPEIAAAWERGDIDARLCLGSGARPDQDDRQGRAGLLAESPHGARRPSTPGSSHRICRRASRKSVRDFVKVTGAGLCRVPGASRTPGSARRRKPEKIAKLTGAKLEEVPALLKGYVFPTLEEQASDNSSAVGRSRRSRRHPPSSRSRARSTPCLPDYTQICVVEIRQRGAGLELPLTPALYRRRAGRPLPVQRRRTIRWRNS